MSEENVNLVRKLAEGFQRRQHEQAFEFYDPEIEWDASRMEGMNMAAGVYHGFDGVREFGGTGFQRGATFTSRFRACWMRVTT